MTATTETNTTPSQTTLPTSFGGVEEVQRVADADRSVKESKAGEALAARLGISVEELDRRLQAEDKQRDAAGQPPLAWSKVVERAALDDFAPDPAKQAHTDHDAKTDFAPSAAVTGKTPSAERSDTGNQVEDASRERDDTRRQREAEQHQREATKAAQRKFDAIGGDVFDRYNRTVISDKGSKLVAYNSRPETAKAVAGLAESKGWSTIKVSGTAEFKREVWLEASLRGMQVQGYKPNESDIALLNERAASTTLNKVQVIEPTVKTEKGRVIETIAKTIVAAKVASENVRDKVMQEVRHQLERREAQRRVPTVQRYDIAAPVQPRDYVPVVQPGKSRERSR